METSPERIEPAGSVLAKVPTFSSAVLLMVLVVVSWASATVASKHLYLSHLITPLSLVVLRFTLAGSLSLAIFAALKLRRRRTKRVQMVKQIQVENVDETTGWPLVGSWRVYLFGGSLITLFITGYNLALVHISASLGGLVFLELLHW